MFARSLFVLGFLASLAQNSLDAAQYLIVTHVPNGAWSLQGVESIAVNGKEKVRNSAIAATRPRAWDPKSVTRLPDSAFAAFSVIRRAPDGNVWAKAGATTEWTLLLPDGLKGKTSGSAATLWNASIITIKKDKADKEPLKVPVESLYAILPGADVAGSAAQAVTRLELLQAPGVDETTAFRQSVELIPPAISTFPSGAASEKIRDSVRSGMTARLERWTAGDAAITTLDEGLLLVGASERAFAADPAQKTLRNDLRDARRRLDRRIAILRVLDKGRKSDAFLVAYREFEALDRSFPELAQARRKHLEASAMDHIEKARASRQAGDYAASIRHLRVAQIRNPKLAEASKLLEEVRLEVARLSSQQFTDLRAGIDPRSPTQVQVQRRLRLAEQYILDSKPTEAEKALDEAESIDKDEARIKLLQAELSVLRGDLGLAIALLDVYAGMAITPQDFEQGEKLRASVQYKIENQRTQTRTQLKTLFDGKRFGMALQSAVDGLKVDNEEPAFLYQAAVNACVLYHCAEAAPLLRRFLTLTDSVSAAREQRVGAVRLLRIASEPARQAAAGKSKSGAVSWFSGGPIDGGVFYDPISLAFQAKVARITASEHLNVTYDWAGSQLHAIHTKYEEKKTASNIARLALGVGMAAGGGVGSVAWKTPDRETNDFYFNYYDDVPQVFNVARDNRVVKSRTISVMIPGMGFGGFGSFAGLGGFEGLGGLSAMGGMKGLNGMGNWAGLMATASSVSKGAGLSSLAGAAGSAAGTGSDFAPRTYSIHGDPAEGSTNGYLTLWNNPRLDTEVAFVATGKRVTVGFSGNHYFHPFAFDGIHLFEFEYDREGRVVHARELHQPNPPRLDFAWDGRRLLGITARENSPAAYVVYSRTLAYSGEKLTGETIVANGKTSRIQYKYDKQGRLTEAECSDDPTLDGRSRKVEFLLDTVEKGREAK
jgi:YD repeat-containing protein